MPYKLVDLQTGLQNINETSTVRNHDLGTMCNGQDEVLGEGRFIYLRGVASTIVGSAVVFDTAFQTTLAVAASRGAVAIAMSANVANQFGWYQVLGTAVVSAATVVANTACQLTAVAGQLDDTTTATNFVDGAVFKSATGTPAANQAYAQINYPTAQGR